MKFSLEHTSPAGADAQHSSLAPPTPDARYGNLFHLGCEASARPMPTSSQRTASSHRSVSQGRPNNKHKNTLTALSLSANNNKIVCVVFDFLDAPPRRYLHPGASWRRQQQGQRRRQQQPNFSCPSSAPSPHHPRLAEDRYGKSAMLESSR